jgi:hypothetical protein
MKLTHWLQSLKGREAALGAKAGSWPAISAITLKAQAIPQNSPLRRKIDTLLKHIKVMANFAQNSPVPSGDMETVIEMSAGPRDVH